MNNQQRIEFAKRVMPDVEAAAIRLEVLPARQREAPEHAADGLTIAETAVAMGCSPKNVENLRTRTFAALGVSGVLEAIKLVWLARLKGDN